MKGEIDLMKEDYKTACEIKAGIPMFEALFFVIENRLSRFKGELRAPLLAELRRELENSSGGAGDGLQTAIDIVEKHLGIFSTCQTCNGSGQVEFEYTDTEAGCCEQPLENGECCGNAVPVPVQTQGIQQCPDCHGEKNHA